jgi:hypothetical protein
MIAVCGRTRRPAAKRDLRADPDDADIPTVLYIASMRFEKVWIEQCRATQAIKRRFD